MYEIDKYSSSVTLSHGAIGRWRLYQSMLSEPVIRRVDVLASQGHPGAQALATYFVGQGVGLMNKVKPAREVVREFIEDYLAATERLSNSLPD